MSVITMCVRRAARSRLAMHVKAVPFVAGAVLALTSAGSSQAKVTAGGSQQEEPAFDLFSWAQPEPEPQTNRRFHGHPHARRTISGAASTSLETEQGSGSNAVLSEASRWIGHGNVTGTHRAWCADFANFVLRRTGHKASGSGMADSLLGVGARVSNPGPGDIVVMRSHVTIFAGYGGRGFYGLGGNQHHRVAMSNYPLRSVVAFVRPN